MEFNKDDYQVENVTINDLTIKIRSFRNRIYVEHPVCEEFQQMNIFAPECYYQGECINGYSLHTAPIFLQNTVGGYMPGYLDEPAGISINGQLVPNTPFRALQHGYVVAVPALRGRVLQNGSGEYIGKAPACIIDYKAAVRYLRHFSDELPGDVEKMITNGTSAGGALSSLMGATGNHPDYREALTEIGAANERDDVFAASCYCPIINLDNADMAYEWQFLDVNRYHEGQPVMDKAQAPTSGTDMSELQIKTSRELAKQFPDYVNSLNLKDENGSPLTLDSSGNGSFKEYVKQLVIRSAQKALDAGSDLSGKSWLTICGNQVQDMDWHGYVRDITRMKPAPAFDALTMEHIENDLFGNQTTKACHFTKYAAANSLVNGKMAEALVIKMLNPMDYIEDANAVKARYWRIRHGECDRDTSLSISALLALKLREQDCKVDHHAPWNISHAGDYDLDELFLWIDTLCHA